MSVAPPQDRLSGWGRVFGPGREVRSTDLERLTVDVPLTRGLGRSYGDASLPAPGDATVAGTALADRVVSFDADSGLLTAEAGFSLLDLNRTFWPRGFCAPVALTNRWLAPEKGGPPPPTDCTGLGFLCRP